MKLNEVKSVYFIGIGGIGMSALARYFFSNGAKVAGYDRTETKLTKSLQQEGIEVHFEEQPQGIEKYNLVIYTPAIPKANKELQCCIAKGLPLKKRSEVLGELSALYPTVAIAGTHGKTSVTSMVSHLFKQANINVTAFLGGIASNYNSNLILSNPTQIQVMEADEFDRSFLKLKPSITAVTSIDADHLDVYEKADTLVESYQAFAGLATQKTFLKKEIQNQFSGISTTYSITDKEADYFGANISVTDGNYQFDLNFGKGTIKNLRLGLAGRHNVENAVLASAVFLENGGNENQLREGLASFKGIKRRFEKQFDSNQKVYIDDYAHHPTEIKALLTSVREMYPNDSICGFFQPHLFSRTRDFGDGFAKVLSELDEVYLLPIYPAREEPIEGISSEWLLESIAVSKKAVIQPNQLPKVGLDSNCRVLLTIGAGDIDKQVEPLKSKLHETFS